MSKDYIQNYLVSQEQLLSSIDTAKVNKLIEIVNKAWEEDRQIFVCGNGGSASNASHFVTDLYKAAGDTKRKPCKAITLNDNVSLMTALANDHSFGDIFTKQLEANAEEGDLFIALSVSGNSVNVVNAMRWASENKLQTVALVGGHKGKLAEMASFSIELDELHYGRVEDAQMMICHMVCYSFIEAS